MKPPYILDSDNHLVVAVKATGMTTEDIADFAALWLKKEGNKPGNVFIQPTHQLDKMVSGIVLLAKTSKALSRVNKTFREREGVEKEYIALIEGDLGESGTLEHTLIQGDHRAHVVGKDHPEGKLAILTYERIGTWKNGTCVRIFLKTGRYHQIRIQFAEMGAPILGDQRYGARLPFEVGAIALHHKRLLLPHPVGGVPVQWICPVPKSFGVLCNSKF